MNIFTEWLEERFPEVGTREFYRIVFPLGELEKKGEYVKGKYNGIIVAVTNERKYTGKVKVKRYTLTDGLEALDEVAGSDDFCLCSPLSYAGKSRTAENARYLYALAVDVDRLRKIGEKPQGLSTLWHQIITERDKNTEKTILPHPTFIVSSGTGIHLYYVLEEPVPLFREYAFELQELKRDLTRLIWNDYVVDIDSPHDIQQEGIYQGFRMPGTITKNGDRARAFQTGGRVTLQYLNSFMIPGSRAERAAIASKKRGKLTLEEAAKKYPEWYDKRIIRQEPRGTWHTSRRVYDWWKDKIEAGATVGHRYYCIMMLAIYAKKCSYYDEKHNPLPVTQEELERDAYGLIEKMEKLTDSEDNHFGAADVQDALEAFQERWTTYPRTAIEYRTAIQMPENKRNKQKQADHLEEARAIRDIRSQRRGERWDAHNGRKSKANIVLFWKESNPMGTVAECIKETGLSRATVYRHWNGVQGKRQETDQRQEMEKRRRLNEQIIEGNKELEKRIRSISAAIAELPEDQRGQYIEKIKEIAAGTQAAIEEIEKQ